ncbi:MAG: DUF2857 family protein [Rhodocyclaceae bacterium]|nr:DUF2857 family protein [Rhodocyclaceae bacterium]
MYPIADPVLRLAILAYLVKRIDDGAFQPLIEAGFSPDELDDLRGRPTRDLARMVDMGLSLDVVLRPPDYRDIAGSLDRQEREVALMDYFLIHDAQPELVAILFRVSAKAMRERLTVLCGGATTRRRGRPARSRATEADLGCIRRGWPAVAQAHASTVERLYAMHQLVKHLRIDDLCHALEAEFETFHRVPADRERPTP